MQKAKKSKTIKSYFYKNKLWFSILMLSDFIEAFAIVAVSYFISRVFDAVGKASMDSIIKLMPIGALVLAFYFFAQYFQKYSRRKFLKKIDTQVRTEVFSGIISKNYSDFGEKNTAEYISVMNNELEKIEDDYLSKVPYMLETMILSIIAATSLFLYSTEMAIVIIVSALIPIVVPALLGNRISEATDSFMDGMAQYNVKIKDIFGGYEVIKSFNAEKVIRNVHGDALASMEDRKYKYRSVGNLFDCITEIITWMIIVIQYIIAAYLITKGNITLAAAMGALQLGNTVNNQFREATSSFISVKGTKKIQERMNQLLCETETVTENIVPDGALGDICVKNLSFAYEDENDTLKNINFTFEEGKKYAIVGGSGSGKSTLIKLIMQYYSNYKGEIYCGDTDIQKIQKKSLYSKMAMIHQKVFMFDDTLKNNITMYQNYSENEILDVVEKAGLEDVVKKNAEGLEQNVGEGGSKLSGGEQQRIAIARALLKKSNVLILDEATSSLDTEVADKIENTVLQQKNLTAIVVTHKLAENILRKYDGIVVLHKGEIVEYGTFDELMENKSKFYGLYMLSI